MLLDECKDWRRVWKWKLWQESEMVMSLDEVFLVMLINPVSTNKKIEFGDVIKWPIYGDVNW